MAAWRVRSYVHVTLLLVSWGRQLKRRVVRRQPIMIEPKRARWRMVILPIGFLAELYAFYLSLSLDYRPLQIALMLAVIAIAWDLATLWKRRYW